MVVNRIPFRLRVLRALSAKIEEVNPDNGYHFDLRGRVFRGRVRYDDNDPIPMVSILEAPIPQEVIQSRGDNQLSVGPWELLIQGFASDDRENPSDQAHHMMAEVKAVLVGEKQREDGLKLFGMRGRVFEMFIGQGSVRPPDDTTEEAFFWLTLTLKLSEDLSRPYE
jgi:hypothetical protein